MRITVMAIVALAIGFAIAVVWKLRTASEPTETRADVVERAPAPTETVVDTPDLRHTAADVAADAQASPAEPETATSDSVTTQTPAPLPGETPVMPMAQLLESAGLQIAPELAQREREFAAQSVDARWAPRAEGDILNKFAEMPGLALISLQVECRSTMCRVQAASRELPGGFNILIDSIDLEARVKIAIIDPSGALQSVAYLERESLAPE